MKLNTELINSSSQLPKNPAPVIIIGTGGIVKDAHLPAYRLAGFTVCGIYDLDKEKATALAGEFAIQPVYHSLADAIANAPAGCIFDLALPASASLDVLKQLPVGAAVLMQKPMGDNLQQADQILEICRSRKLVAAVNFQLRYAPYMLAAKDIISKGWIGEVCDVEFNINVFTPWHLWGFLYQLPRVEILYHSIHYLDFVRHLLGEPTGILAKTTRHPNSPGLASVRSDIIMDYGEYMRANIHTDHNHNFGSRHQHAYLKIEGTHGAIMIQLGVLMDYPKGAADKFEFVSLKESLTPTWQEIPVAGSWFPHAFIGSMAQLMCFAEGTSGKLDHSVEDAIQTMRWVEAAYGGR